MEHEQSREHIRLGCSSSRLHPHRYYFLLRIPRYLAWKWPGPEHIQSPDLDVQEKNAVEAEHPRGYDVPTHEAPIGHVQRLTLPRSNGYRNLPTAKY